MSLESLERYVRHATQWGGVREVWEVAQHDFDDRELIELGKKLALIAKQRGEPFRPIRRALPPNGQRIATLLKTSNTGGGLAVTKRPENAPVGNPLSSTPTAAEGRICALAGCCAPLPSSLRDDAVYCVGGKCKQKMYRKQRKNER